MKGQRKLSLTETKTILENALPRWLKLEEWLFSYAATGGRFTSRSYAAAAGISGEEASQRIQCYLEAQRRPNSRTLYVLKREPGTRTSKAVWSVGERTADVRAIGLAYFDDTVRRFTRAVERDLERVAEITPQTRRRVTAMVESTFSAVSVILANAVNGATPDDTAA